MSNNVNSYDIMSKYYKFIYNHQISNENHVVNYLTYILINLKKSNKFLDIGCGTGIFTQKLHNNFSESIGIDPCKSMIDQVTNNKNIKYYNLFLHEYDGKNFDLITSFSQVINHLKTYDLLFDFIKYSSEKLNDEGLFYFDVFNNKYFEFNNPSELKRDLSPNMYYKVKPTKLEKKLDHTFMKLENYIYDNGQTYNYDLDIYMWDIDLIIQICQINNLVIIQNTKMLDLQKTDTIKYHKISLLFKKIKRIDLISNKVINPMNINKLLERSINLKTLTNYGPNVKLLEYLIRQKFKINDNKSIIVTNNGSSALQTLALGIQKFEDNFNNWTTQSFTFVSAHQGSLSESEIVDIDNDYSLDLSLVNKNSIGIILTNIFGNICNIEKYENWCKDNNKFLIFDNAATPYTFYNNINSLNYGNGSIISFHHTKGLGYGEGGAIIIDNKYESMIRNLINFKSDKTIFDKNGNNFKMSEISACYILSYLENMENIINYNKELYSHFKKLLSNLDNFKLYPKFYDGDDFFSTLIPIICENNSKYYIEELKKNNIFSKKYYKPLDNSKKSNDLYEKILCIPCHHDMLKEDIDNIINILKTKPKINKN